MYRGINVVNLDAKGRLAIPARYRTALQEEANGHLIITIDTEDNCLLLYPLPVWRTIEHKVAGLPSFNRTTRRIQRLLIGHATDVDLDSSGRILIPPLLRDYAGLTKRVMLIGQGKKIELWDDEKWNSGRKNWLSEGIKEGLSLPEQLQDISL